MTENKIKNEIRIIEKVLCEDMCIISSVISSIEKMITIAIQEDYEILETLKILKKSI